MAHRLAIESDYVRSDMVEVIEFPHIANKYGVQGVPKIVVNEEIEFVGALPEPLFVAQVMRVMEEKQPFTSKLLQGFKKPRKTNRERQGKERKRK